ncbi:glutaredoxin [Pseudomaricurvus alkylphenolicus]|uniref:glutaredoxin family protein n=1 Tax=Pseudomaricurvus alkylphenolicus TaxID=1306991 RepID=UPI001422A986|nr:glutathione S-transferase N-terminal domain-containing protein [Pseudomaricurvus alkylphenolicus]NIB45139.1 glutaredoxin [Pseudomaricurvus alkylphenolicus]
MVIVRAILGSLILFFDWLFTPRGVKRDSDAQKQLDAQTSGLTLYQYKACPFCVKVRRAIKRQSLAIETRDAKRCDSARDELVAGGGRLKVPCLRIEEASGESRWMYESGDIIRYLEGRFGQAA